MVTVLLERDSVRKETRTISVMRSLKKVFVTSYLRARFVPYKTVFFDEKGKL